QTKSVTPIGRYDTECEDSVPRPESGRPASCSITCGAGLVFDHVDFVMGILALLARLAFLELRTFTHCLTLFSGIMTVFFSSIFVGHVDLRSNGLFERPPWGLPCSRNPPASSGVIRRK